MQNDLEEKSPESFLCLRPFETEDKPAVIKLGESSGMGTLTAFENITVALHENSLVGFIRLSVYENMYYVNPVVVVDSWRKRGLGSLLMNHSLDRHTELRFVARGYAVPFYLKLGCEPIPWDMIADEFVAECDECDQLSTCSPQPMRMLKM